jgi:hypothetical protein
LPHATAALDLHTRLPGETAQCIVLRGAPIARAIEVNNMNPLGAARFKRGELFEWIAIGGDIVELAEREAHALATEHIDCRKDQHGNARKL